MLLNPVYMVVGGYGGKQGEWATSCAFPSLPRVPSFPLFLPRIPQEKTRERLKLEITHLVRGRRKGTNKGGEGGREGAREEEGERLRKKWGWRRRRKHKGGNKAAAAGYSWGKYNSPLPARLYGGHLCRLSARNLTFIPKTIMSTSHRKCIIYAHSFMPSSRLR